MQFRPLGGISCHHAVLPPQPCTKAKKLGCTVHTCTVRAAGATGRDRTRPGPAGRAPVRPTLDAAPSGSRPGAERLRQPHAALRTSRLLTIHGLSAVATASTAVQMLSLHKRSEAVSVCRTLRLKHFFVNTLGSTRLGSTLFCTAQPHITSNENTKPRKHEKTQETLKREMCAFSAYTYPHSRHFHN